jgi:small subunit ribosomal protein S24e
MNLEIRKTKKNPVIGRDEITADLFFEGATPSRTNLLKDAAKKLNCPEDLLVIHKITTSYGDEKAEVSLHKYESKDALAKCEPKYMQKKHRGKEEKKQAEAE